MGGKFVKKIEKTQEDIILINEKEAAEIMSLSRNTLRMWRCRKKGPAYIKLGQGYNARVRYKISDLEEFIERNKVQPSH